MFNKKLPVYIGQKRILRELENVIEVCKKEKKVIPHILFYGSRGAGKTQIAKYVADLSEHPFIDLTAGSLSVQSIGDLLCDLKKNTILFLDEIHSLSRKISEELYSPMQSFVGHFKYDKEYFDVDIEPFTLIGATTNAGELEKPLLDRFVYSFFMDKYTTEELCQIIEVNPNCKKSYEPEAIKMIAKIAQNNPRLAVTTAIGCENFTREQTVTIDTVNELMEVRNINPDGVSKIQVDYLKLLIKEKKPIGSNHMSKILEVPESTIENNIEPFLLQKQYISRTGSGRIITQEGRRYLL